MIVEGHGKGFSRQKVQPDKDLREESLACLRNHKLLFCWCLKPEAREGRPWGWRWQQQQRIRSWGFLMRVTRETGLCESWKLTYPGYHPRGSRPLAQGCGRAEPGWGWWGCQWSCFSAPSCVATSSWWVPLGRGGTGLFGFTTPLPSPSVSGGQEKRKRYADFLLGPGACEPRRVFRKGGGRGGAQKDLSAHMLSAE